MNKTDLLYMKPILFSRILLAVVGFSLSISAQAQCVIDSTVLDSLPGIYPATPPEAVGCNFYDTDVTFVFPSDTIVDVFGVPQRLPFLSFEILDIAGLPQGIDWKCNIDSCFYDFRPSNPDPDTTGCVRLFGTPTIPGVYPLSVLVRAEVLFLGSSTFQNTTFDYTLTVGACQFNAPCYNYTVSSNCLPASLDISNNIPSNGNAGYSYQWDLQGPNGPIYSTTDENPFSQMLPDPGQYVLSYQAEIDTVGFILDSVVVDSLVCSDLLDAPDLYWILLAPDGSEVVNTSANPASNSGNNLPYNLSINNLRLDTGTYELQVWDQDDVLGDQGCATNDRGSGASVFFTVPTFNTGPQQIIQGGLAVTISIRNPIQQIACSDTFEVSALPNVPDIVGDTSRICSGETLFLSTASTDSIQWFLDGFPIPNANDSIYAATQEGDYTVVITNRNTLCSSESIPFPLELFRVQVPSIAFDGNRTLTVASPDPAYRYDWVRQNHGVVGSGSPFMIPNSGDYTAIAVDTVTGCQSGPSATIGIILTSLADLDEVAREVKLYPNPNEGQFVLSLELLKNKDISFVIRDALGREILGRDLGNRIGYTESAVNLSHLPAGFYTLSLKLDELVVHKKFLKK